MAEEQERLARVEVEVNFLKASFGEVKSALIQLAEDMHKLAVAEAERASDREALKRAFEGINAIQQSVAALGGRLSRVESIRTEMELASANKQLAEAKRLGWEITRTLIAVGGALALYHFGIKPL